MKTQAIQFNSIVDTIYNLPLEEKVELRNLLEHNIADTRRDEIVLNFAETQKAQKAKKLKFSSNIQELKQML
jgi:hypothetical protein